MIRLLAFRSPSRLPLRWLALAAMLAGAAPAVAQTAADDALAQPALRAEVQVSSDLVRIGDLVDNAGSAALIAVYRAPDLGTTGTLSAAEVVATLRTHHVIGIDTRGLTEVSVTRLSRALTAREVEQHIARALERRNGLGEAADIAVTFDRELRTLQLDAGSGEMKPVYARFDARNGRFDAMFEIAGNNGAAPTKLRFTGTAVETAEAAVLTRSVERNDILKASDVVTERRPKAELGPEPARRDLVIGMQARKPMRAGQVIRSADLGRPDIVQRDQMVTLVFRGDGLFLTMRAKATEGGAEGDTVNVMNLQSKRTVQGVVTGPGQVTVSPPPPITTASIPAAPTAAQKAE
jgi:flagella basal body P-ring formation protein FlgA